MNESKHQAARQDGPPDDTPKSDKRRRLLRAAAAVPPVIGTLRSGAVFANTSGYQCIGRDATRADTAAMEQLSASSRRGDGWLEITGSRVSWTGTYTAVTPPAPDTLAPDSESADTATDNEKKPKKNPKFDLLEDELPLPAEDTTPPPADVEAVTLHFNDLVWLDSSPAATALEGLPGPFADASTALGSLTALEVTGYTLSWSSGSTEDYYAIVYVLPNNDATDIIGGPNLIPDSHDGWQPLTASCWVSVGGVPGSDW